MWTLHSFLTLLSEFKKFLTIVDLVYMHSLISSLEQLLSDAEDADAFASTSERIQRLALNDLLGEGMSELVNSIIQSSVVCGVLLHFHDYLFTFLDRAYVAQYLSRTE